MLRDRLLRLYPRAWRERYAAEFLATVEPGPLSVQQVIDIVSGAIDARLSSDVRRATAASRIAPSGGGSMKSLAICERNQARYSKRDGLIGAGVMIAATIILSIAGIAVRRAGWPATGEVIVSLAFSGSLTLSMPFWLMKGQPWKAQAVIIGGTLALLVAIAWLATLI
jgi:hypothetical protein